MNNTGADQPAHPRSLISAFVIPYLESTICKLATGEIPILKLVSVAEEIGLKLVLSETPKTGFLAMRPIINAITSHPHTELDLFKILYFSQQLSEQ